MNTFLIVGRPNVGKSALFNRLTKSRKSLVFDQEGVTRDCIEGCIQHLGHDLQFVDSGGIGESTFGEWIQEQVQDRLQRVVGILFVVDSRVGVTTLDQRVWDWVRRSAPSTAPITLVFSKCDDPYALLGANCFDLGGMKSYFQVSAFHGSGIEELLNHCVLQLPAPAVNGVVQSQRVRHIALVGRPNVGKSSLTNALLGKKQVVVSPIAGTTTDAIALPWSVQGDPYVLVDTAGVRSKAKTQQGIECLSFMQTKAALKQADLACLLIDGSQGVVDQDKKIANLILESHTSALIVVSKWDEETKEAVKIDEKELIKRIRRALPFLDYAPLVLTSAKERKGLGKLKREAMEILSAREEHIPVSELTRLVRHEMKVTDLHKAKVYLVKQLPGAPPAFRAFVNHPKHIPSSLVRHWTKVIRKLRSFKGSPLHIEIKKSTRPEVQT